MNAHILARRRRQKARGDEGSALIVTMLVLFMLMMLVMTLAGTNVARSEASVHARFRVQLLAAADAGIGFKMREVLAVDADPASFVLRTYSVEGISVETFAEDAGGGVIRLQSRATDARGMRRVVEAYMATETHPLFSKSVYVGNKDTIAGYKFVVGPTDGGIKNPASGETTAEEHTGSTATTIDEGIESDPDKHNVSVEGDYVEGDVFVNGNAEIRGKTNVYGNIDATGTVSGRPVSWEDPVTSEDKEGITTEGATNVVPPDLHAMNYMAMAQEPGGFVVQAGTDTSSVSNTSVDFINHGSFVSGDDTYFNNNPDEFDRANFQFGQPGMSGQTTYHTLTNLNQISGAGDQIIYIKGNLWLETGRGAGFKVPSSTNGKKVTIVVEGNLYVSDELSYNDYAKDAFLFVVKGAADDPSTTQHENESFVDGYDADGNFNAAYMNGVYDEGERLINDEPAGVAGHGTYNGPNEGQGNIYFGDRTQSWGGITDGFMYAENNGYLVTNVTEKEIFGVRGFFSAGGILDMGSAGGPVNRALVTTTTREERYRDRWGRWQTRTVTETKNAFTNYRVKFDSRIADGTISLKGMPAAQGGGFAGMSVVAWRELAPGAWSPPAP